MKTPPLLLAAALLFWGWQTGHLAAGAAMAAALEVSRVVKTRWEFTDDEFSQLWNFCSLLFVGAAVYAFAANEGTAAVTTFIQARSFGERSNAMNQGAQAAQVLVQWLPFVFFPFMAAQAFSQRAEVGVSTFSLWLRRKKRLEEKAGRKAVPGRTVNASYPYFGVCLVAACALNERGLEFYAGLCLLLAWALWQERNLRFNPLLWASAILLAAGLGFLGSLGLRELQGWVENIPTEWMSRFARRGFDPKESRTALGEVGKIKLSGRIVLRLEVPEGDGAPPLLRESSYNAFRSPSWLGSAKTFEPVMQGTNETSWVLGREAKADRSVRIAGYLKAGQGLLALPTGVRRVDDLPAGAVETNSLGTVRVKEGPGLVMLAARYAAGSTIDTPPDTADWEVPLREEPALARICSELKLPAPTPAESLRRVFQFFQGNFEYRLLLTEGHRGTTNETALSRFLLHERGGHCEYFATATTLLLRKAGIPARYAVGYSVQESAGHNRFVVRDRHAHAWCIYYDATAKNWLDFDTTPGSWVASENKRARFWEPITDAWSRVWFEFQKLRWGRSAFRQYALAGLGLLLVTLALRFFLRKRWRQGARSKPTGKRAAMLRQGLDSEFYLVERELTARGLERRSGETLSTWLARIEPAAPGSLQTPRALLSLHYRYRFDPVGVPESDRAKLRQEVEAWLAQSNDSR